MPYKKDVRHQEIGSRRRAVARYAMIRHRITHTDTSRNKNYAGVKLLVNRDDFIQWFMGRDFKGCSVDRIDSSGHYELSNMQVIPLATNIRKDKAIACDGKCRCYACKEIKNESEFATDKRRANGFATICKSCDGVRVKTESALARENRLQRMRNYYQTVTKQKQQAGSTGR